MYTPKSILTILFLLFFGFGLYAQPKAVGEPRVVAKTDEPLERPVWSADGKKLTFTSLKDGANWEVSRDGKNLKKVSGTAGIRRSSGNANALLQQMIDEPREVASTVKGLKSLSEYIIFNPVLSPNGDKIVFEVSRGKGMYICNADGSGLRSLGSGAERATWTPDGKYIIVMKVTDDGHVFLGGELFVIDVTTGERTVLLSSDKYIAFNPALSPDGKQLAFEEHNSGVIYIIDIQ